MKITDLSSSERPRERMEQQGASALSNAELLAVILKSGTHKENVLVLCQKLLSKYGLESLASCSLQELMQEHGIGRAKACQLLALFELARRLQIKQKNHQVLRTPEEVAALYLPRLSHLQQEYFLALYLDAKHRLIDDQIITKGTVDTSLVHPREVFQGAIKHLASSIIVVHNHPSGDCTPSEEDIVVTTRLAKTGEIMGIPLLDHVIIGKDSWWSWRGKGS